MKHGTSLLAFSNGLALLLQLLWRRGLLMYDNPAVQDPLKLLSLKARMPADDMAALDVKSPF